MDEKEIDLADDPWGFLLMCLMFSDWEVPSVDVGENDLSTSDCCNDVNG